MNLNYRYHVQGVPGFCSGAESELGLRPQDSHFSIRQAKAWKGRNGAWKRGHHHALTLRTKPWLHAGLLESSRIHGVGDVIQENAPKIYLK